MTCSHSSCVPKARTPSTWVTVLASQPSVSIDTETTQRICSPILGRQLGLKPCFTPVRSPQSNGISEAFVKTLKRDYVQVTPPPDARNVPELIGARINDDNEHHPHSGLKMRSPREFIAAQTATA